MGNLICIYAILVVPLYWILNFVTVFNDDNPFLEETWFYLAYGINLIVMQLASLGITISLAIGGVRLRDLRASGERLVRLTLSLGLVLVAMQWIFFLAMLILGGLAGAWEESSGSSISIFDTLQTALQTAAFFWDIVCLVWLLRNRSRLPLILNS